MQQQSNPDHRISVAIADDHTLVRDGLRRILEQEPDITVVAEAANGREAMDSVQRFNPDVLLLDISMPECDGMQVLRELRLAPTHTRVLLLTAAIDKNQVAEAIRLGACGMVMKTSAINVLIRSIRAVTAGEYWFDRSTLAELAKTQPDQGTPLGLTDREVELIGLLAGGKSNKEIADHLEISETTVKRHLANIFRKTGVSSRLELAVLVLNHKLEIPR